MAFCPECGKPVTVDAANCQACGLELPVEAKRVAPRRFNATMMMASPVSVRPGATAPANANAKAKSEAAQPEAPAPANASVLKQNSASVVGAAPARAALKAAKATMLGTGGSPHVARAVAVPRAEAAVAVPRAEPVVAIPRSEPALATAAPAPLQAQSAPVEVAETLRPPEAQVANANSDVERLREEPASRRAAPEALRLRTDDVHDDEPSLMPAEVLDSGALPRHVEATAVLDKDYARQSWEPQLSAATNSGRPARLRLADDEEGPLVVPKAERFWVYWAACGVVVVSVMLLAYGFGLFW